MPQSIFPKDFIWGASTASYQIEGAFNEDGRGESIWDRFSHTPSKVDNGDTGNIACNHYALYKDDINLMKELGLQSYRYSIAWPRIFPDGKGKPNQKGMDFYLRLTENLLENGIKPAITLYHWDLPQKLQDIGGWNNRDVTDYFTEYSSYIFQKLGDMVPIWMTHNEPWCTAFLGNMTGLHAPGITDTSTALEVSHNLLLSHGKVVQLYRDMNLNGKIGIVLNFSTKYPASQSKEDLHATWLSDGVINRWFLDPLFKGTYPEDTVALYKAKGAHFSYPEEDLKIISKPMDFLGVNYYSSEFIQHCDQNFYKGINSELKQLETTDMGWIVYPQGLHDLLVRLHNDCGKIDLYIAENGAAYKDAITHEGRIEDIERQNYLLSHIKESHRAIEHGVNLKGYYVWSLMDNFEWSFGYSKRFGIVHVDFESQKRTVKQSGYLYKNIINQNGI